jgi:NAD(P)-dependent dehydrogenase (short-subunit alcohol dehydrogenase family)
MSPMRRPPVRPQQVTPFAARASRRFCQFKRKPNVPGVTSVAGGASYAASKHAIIGMTKSAALDYAKQNIRVNAVLPGNIATPMMDRFTGGDVQKAIDLEPVGRLGKPEENRGGRAVDVFRPRPLRDRVCNRG